MQISSWKHKQQKPKNNLDGSWEGEYLTAFGDVDVFTFPGDKLHREFTSLHMRIDGWSFSANIQRYYDVRWLGRLAAQFALKSYHIYEDRIGRG